MHPRNFLIVNFPTSLTKILPTALLVLGCTVAVAARAQQSTPAQRANTSQISRGKYLVEDVAMCSQCHTPRDSAGNLDHGRWLQGGGLWYQPANPVPDWPQQVPRIGGTVSATDGEMVRLLTTGIWKTGQRLRSPMPQFRMSPEDAAAVIAYLRTLNPSSPAQQEPQ
jgi:mono/diheme cytochrome c family protein